AHGRATPPHRERHRRAGAPAAGPARRGFPALAGYRGARARGSVMTTVGDQSGYAAGFACLIGRPNAGKSTLTNALVGQKVAITSSTPQTTRHTIRGIVTSSTGQ